MRKRAVLVACSGTKRDKRNPSWSLYSSTLFEKSWALACIGGDPYVMSAKHHLLGVDDRLDPYDETLKNYTWDEKVEWAETVASQLPDQYEHVVLLGGRDYVEPLKEVLDRYRVEDIYEECSGNGEQMAKATELIESSCYGAEK